jgi:hypothetical protein
MTCYGSGIPPQARKRVGGRQGCRCRETMGKYPAFLLEVVAALSKQCMTCSYSGVPPRAVDVDHSSSQTWLLCGG